MGYRLGCPSCDGWTSAIFRAYEEGLPCPYCGASLSTPENAKHFHEQLPDWRSGAASTTLRSDDGCM